MPTYYCLEGLISYSYVLTVYRYILGVNQEAVEIEMTRPVPTSVIQVEDSNFVDQEMCFWLGSPYESKEVNLNYIL